MSEVERDMEFAVDWMEEYVHMAADPSNHKTAVDFCREKGMSEQNFYKWKSRHREQVNKRIEKLRGQYVTDFRSKSWKALSRQLEKGDTPAIKLGFQLTGDLVEKTEQVNSLTPDEKKARIVSMFAELKAKKLKSLGDAAEEPAPGCQGDPDKPQDTQPG